MYSQSLSKDFYGENALSWMHNSQYTYQHKYPFVSTSCSKILVPIDHLTHYFFHLLCVVSALSTMMVPFFNLQNTDFKTKTKEQHPLMGFSITQHYQPCITYCFIWEYPSFTSRYPLGIVWNNGAGDSFVPNHNFLWNIYSPIKKKECTKLK